MALPDFSGMRPASLFARSSPPHIVCFGLSRYAGESRKPGNYSLGDYTRNGGKICSCASEGNMDGAPGLVRYASE
jgi:hypothetical protein